MDLDRRLLLMAASAGPIALSTVPARAQADDAAARGIDATVFGVIADLVGVQTGALQRAIDQAAARRLPLLLPPGRVETDTLTLRPGSRLVGAGPQTQLVSVGNGTVIEATAAPDLFIADLVLDASLVVARGAALAAFTDCERLTLARVSFIAATGNAIALERCGGSIRDCRIDGAAETGIFSLDAIGFEIVNNVVDDCSDNGIQVWRSSAGEDGTIVSHNRISRILAVSGGSGEYGNGVNIFRAAGVIVSANRIADCAYSAVRSNAGSNVQIVNNTCTGLGEVAIYAEFGFEGALVGCNLIDGAATGISITNFNDGGRLAVVSGNIVRNLRTRDHEDRRGIGIGVEADTVVTGNVVEGAPVTGIALGWGPYLRDVSTTNNIVRDCGVGITVSVAEGAGTALIAGNLISGSRSSAIQAFAWDDAMSDELLDGDTSTWPHLVVSGNVKR